VQVFLALLVLSSCSSALSVV